MRIISRTFIAIVLAITNLAANSQSFVKELRTDLDEKWVSTIEYPEGNYIVSIIRGLYSVDDPLCLNYKNIIYKIDRTGNITDSLTFDNTGSLITMGRGIISTGNELILWCAVYDSNDTYHQKALRLTTINENLEVLHDTSYTKPGYYLRLGAPSLNAAGNLVLTIYPENISTGEWYRTATELEVNGTFIREVATDSLLPCSKVVPMPGNNGYIFADMHRITLLDDQLTFVKQLYVPQVIERHLRKLTSFKALNDSLLIITGFVDEPVQWWEPHRDDAAWAVFDKNGQWLSQHAFGLYGYSDYAGRVDFITPDNIYITRWIAGVELQRFWLFNFKADGTENWRQCYTHNGYELSGSVLATSDSSCLLACSYQTENSGYNEYDLVVMKLNRDGTITGIDKPGEAPVNVTVYPNPGASTVSVCGKVAGCLFSMYDNTGRLILQKKLTANNEMLDTADWPAGFYTYRVTGSGSFVAAGKWIKL